MSGPADIPAAAGPGDETPSEVDGPRSIAKRLFELELPRAVFLAYSLLALLLSAVLLRQSLHRGTGELSGWLIAFLVVAVISARRPSAGPLVAGFLAFLLGWVRTYRGGYNLDLGLGLIALAVSLHVLHRAVRGRLRSVDLPGILLLGVAGWSLVSLVFSIARIRAFAPAPGFGYRLYQFNALGFPSDEALVRAAIGATSSFLWWGLYQYARDLRPRVRVLNVAVLLVLLVNAAVLVTQRFFDPGFLHPANLPLIGRLDGVTSFCYALGDAVLALFLLLPLWGVWRGRLGLLTWASVVMIVHAAVASGSRTSLFAIAAASLLWGAVRLVRLSRRRRRLGVYSGLAASLLLTYAAAALCIVTPADHVTPIGRLKEGVERQGLLGHLVATRLGSYPLAFRVMEEYPLSGVGAGLYLAEVSKQHELLAPGLEIQDPYLLTSYAANQFLNVGVELGVPAMLALFGVFALAAAGLWRHRRPGWPDLAVSLAALFGALQLGPSLYNSEALVFMWMVVGLAARGGLVPDEGGREPVRGRRIGSRTTAALLAAAVAVGVLGQLRARGSLSVESQWTRLRWHLGMGLLPQEDGGRWTRPEATFVVDTDAPTVRIRWHAGDEKSPAYRAEVAFYVDGRLVERSPAVSGRIRESVLPLTAAPGRKRISVRVVPPFVPAGAADGSDRRRLGVFIHSVTPQRTTVGKPPPP